MQKGIYKPGTKLTPKMQKFVREYVTDFNGTRAARAAGYAQPNKALKQLLDHPLIARAIKHRTTIEEKHLKLTKARILKELYHLVTRDAKDFLNDDGTLKNISEMPKRARAIIDGFDQKSYLDPTTGERVVETKVKLSAKVTAVDLAMKHKGLFAPTKGQVEVAASLNLKDLVGKPENPEAEIEAKILSIEKQ